MNREVAAKRKDLQFIKGNHPLKRYGITRKQLDGSVIGYDFTDATITLICKATVDDDDVDALFTLESPAEITIVPPESDGVIDVQFQDGDLDTAGNFVYRVDMESGPVVETVMWGDLVVLNR